MIAETGSQPITYTPNQQALIAQLLKEVGPGSAHRLVASVGAGKSFGIAGAVAALMKAGRVSRILVLLPAALKSLWTQLLEQFEVEVFMLGGRSIRVMRNEFAHGMSLPEGVFTISISLGKRADVREWISMLPWDFVVIDEAHTLSGQGWELVQSLFAKASPPGLLLSSAFAHENKNTGAGKIVEIDWSEEVEKLRAERQTGKLLTRTYRRNTDEATLAGEVVMTAKRLGTLKGVRLLQCAASSVLCLEESLNRQVGASDLESEDLKMLESLLDLVEELQTDSKLDCFKKLITELSQAGARYTVLFCDYKATLNYLRSAIRDLDLNDIAIHAGMNAKDLSDAFTRFQKDGGILITTSVASRFLSMSFVEAIVHYDLPLSSSAFAQRVGRYDRYGRSSAFTAYCLEDETGALPVETIQLQIAQMANSCSL